MYKDTSAHTHRHTQTHTHTHTHTYTHTHIFPEMYKDTHTHTHTHSVVGLHRARTAQPVNGLEWRVQRGSSCNALKPCVSIAHRIQTRIAGVRIRQIVRAMPDTLGRSRRCLLLNSIDLASFLAICMHTCAHACMQACIHTCMHTCIVNTCACTSA